MILRTTFDLRDYIAPMDSCTILGLAWASSAQLVVTVPDTIIVFQIEVAVVPRPLPGQGPVAGVIPPGTGAREPRTKLVISDAHAIHLLDRPTAKLLLWQGQATYARRMAFLDTTVHFHPDHVVASECGRYCAVASSSRNTVYLCSVPEARILRKLSFSAPVTSLAMSPAGGLLAVGTADWRLHVLDLVTDQSCEASDFPSPPSSLAFNKFTAEFPENLEPRVLSLTPEFVASLSSGRGREPGQQNQHGHSSPTGAAADAFLAIDPMSKLNRQIEALIQASNLSQQSGSLYNTFTFRSRKFLDGAEKTDRWASNQAMIRQDFLAVSCRRCPYVYVFSLGGENATTRRDGPFLPCTLVNVWSFAPVSMVQFCSDPPLPDRDSPIREGPLPDEPDPLPSRCLGGLVTQISWCDDILAVGCVAPGVYQTNSVPDPSGRGSSNVWHEASCVLVSTRIDTSSSCANAFIHSVAMGKPFTATFVDDDSGVSVSMGRVAAICFGDHGGVFEV